jgi:hypothetical protein
MLLTHESSGPSSLDAAGLDLTVRLLAARGRQPTRRIRPSTENWRKNTYSTRIIALDPQVPGPAGRVCAIGL